MESVHYIGLDVHKKTIAYCIKTVAGKTVKHGTVRSERQMLLDRSQSFEYSNCKSSLAPSVK